MHQLHFDTRFPRIASILIGASLLFAGCAQICCVRTIYHFSEGETKAKRERVVAITDSTEEQFGFVDATDRRKTAPRSRSWEVRGYSLFSTSEFMNLLVSMDSGSLTATLECYTKPTKNYLEIQGFLTSSFQKLDPRVHVENVVERQGPISPGAMTDPAVAGVPAH